MFDDQPGAQLAYMALLHYEGEFVLIFIPSQKYFFLGETHLASRIQMVSVLSVLRAISKLGWTVLRMHSIHFSRSSAVRHAKNFVPDAVDT